MPDMPNEFLIEAIARKMCLFYGGNPDDCFTGSNKPYWKLYVNRAKDILDIVLPMIEANVLEREEKK